MAHVVLATFGLKRWVPHCFYLAAQQAVLLLAGLLWLNRGAGTFLITGPLFVLCMVQPGAHTYDSLHYCYSGFYLQSCQCDPHQRVVTLLFLQLVPRGKAVWVRWAYCAAVLLLAYWLAALCRRFYDYSVHTTRMATPMEFVWNQWMPTMQRFVPDTVKSGTCSIGTMVLGLTIAGVGTCAAVLRRFRFTARACHACSLHRMAQRPC